MEKDENTLKLKFEFDEALKTLEENLLQERSKNTDLLDDIKSLQEELQKSYQDVSDLNSAVGSKAQEEKLQVIPFMVPSTITA
jgi:hypothetical protein